MVIELSLLFTGLLGFVPDEPWVEGRGNTLRVVAAYRQDHVTSVLVHGDLVDWGRTTRGDGCVPIGDGFCRFDLQREERVTVGPDTCAREGGCLEAVRTAPEDPECPGPGDWRSLHWVAPMADIVPGNGRMDGTAHRRPHTVPDKVRAHLEVREGVLRVAGFGYYDGDHDDHPDEMIRWRISRGRGADQEAPFHRALADVVEVRREVAGERAWLQFWEREGRRYRRSGRVVLEERGDGGPVVVEVKNVPEGDLCYDRDGSGPFHMGALYGLLEDNAHLGEPEEDGSCEPTADRDARLGPLCGQGAERINDPQCPGALFEPSSSE